MSDKPADLTPAVLAALEAAEKAATPGPWTITRYTNFVGFSIGAGNFGCVVERWEDGTKQLASREGAREANSTLIALARNHLPAILARVRELEDALAGAACGTCKGDKEVSPYVEGEDASYPCPSCAGTGRPRVGK